MEEKKQGIRYIQRDNPLYPDRMRALAGMPEGLYVQGKLPLEDKPSVAVVGARMCSFYGRRLAFEYAKVLSDAGVQVISGMALGIDGESHRGALAGKTPTFAVLGCGTDICYPKSNKDIYEKIPELGGIISEYPPGTKPLSRNFPARNRIISALADLVLVVEARERSGSLITVDCALEQGRNVYAVPGRVGDPLSSGCNRLIFQGAGIAFSPDIILKELGMSQAGDPQILTEERSDLTGDLYQVYRCLDLQPKELNTLSAETGMPADRLFTSLLELQLSNLAVETSKNCYAKC